jgi:hypothetical protein
MERPLPFDRQAQEGRPNQTGTSESTQTDHALDSPYRWRVVSLLLFLIMELLLEHLVLHRFLGIHDREVSLVARLYQPLMAFGPRKLIPRTTTVIQLGSYPGTGVCQARGLLGRVLEQVASYRPKAIVADLTLQPLGSACSHGETRALMRSVQQACQGTPVVFGYDVGPGHVSLPYESIMPRGDAGKCAMGYTNPRRDLRVIPLQDQVDGSSRQSLAWATARMVDNRLANDSDIARSLQTDSPLFAPLFSPGSYQGRSLSDADLFDQGESRNLSSVLQHQVVVIGMGDGETVDTVAGRIPPHLVHAAYIEALLDDHFLRPAPVSVAVAVVLVFWLWLRFVAERTAHQSVWQKALINGGALALALAIVAVLILASMKLVGWYTDLASISITGLFIWLLHSIETAKTH